MEHSASEESEERAEPFPRRLTSDLVQAEVERQEQRVGWLPFFLGGALTLLALGLPTERLWGSLRLLPPVRELPPSRVGAWVELLAPVLGASLERTWFLVSALFSGAAVVAVAGLVRSIGFERRFAVLGAALVATCPLAWLGATVPSQFGLGC